MTNNSKDRFSVINTDFGTQVIVDNETGVEYYKNGNHIIPLLEANGKPKLNREWLSNQ